MNPTGQVRGASNERGYTILQLLGTLSIIVILVTLAGPGRGLFSFMLPAKQDPKAANPTLVDTWGQKYYPSIQGRWCSGMSGNLFNKCFGMNQMKCIGLVQPPFDNCFARSLDWFPKGVTAADEEAWSMKMRDCVAKVVGPQMRKAKKSNDGMCKNLHR